MNLAFFYFVITSNTSPLWNYGRSLTGKHSLKRTVFGVTFVTSVKSLAASAAITMTAVDKRKPGCRYIAGLFCLLDSKERIANAIKL
jgi:hypothetical protein